MTLDVATLFTSDVVLEMSILQDGGGRAPALQDGGGRAPALHDGGGRAPALQGEAVSDVSARLQPRHLRPHLAAPLGFHSVQPGGASSTSTRLRAPRALPVRLAPRCRLR